MNANNNGARWVIAIIVIFTFWYLVSRQDEGAANWMVVLILLSAYTYNRAAVNAELKKLGVLR